MGKTGSDRQHFSHTTFKGQDFKVFQAKPQLPSLVLTFAINYFLRTAERELQTISFVSLMTPHTPLSHTDESALEKNFLASLSP